MVKNLLKSVICFRTLKNILMPYYDTQGTEKPTRND